MPKADRQIYEERSTITRAIVEFHSDDNPNGEPIIIGAGRSNLNIGKLLSVTTNKTLGAPSGTWTVVTKRDALSLGLSSTGLIGSTLSLLRVWDEPEDVWVRIKWVVDGQIIDGMWGLVDSIHESVTRVSGGAREETYTIVGRDVGKIFETLKLWLHHFDPGKSGRSIVAYLNSIGDELRGSPSFFIKLLLETWLGNNRLAEGQWKMPESLGGGDLFYQFLERSIQDMDEGHGALLDPTLLRVEQFQGADTSLWETLIEYSNNLLNEMWIDTGPDPANPDAMEEMKPHFYFRERTFPTLNNRERWDAITQRELAISDVHRRELSKGGAANRYNFWTISIDGKLAVGQAHRFLIQAGAIDGAKIGEPGNIPIVNYTSLQKHGLRKWERSTKYLPILDEEKQANFLNLTANWLRRIHDWYSVAPFQLSGTLITSRIMPEIRVGERIREKRPDGNIQFYCEGIENSWFYPKNGKSTLTVTRGEYEGTDHLQKIYNQIRSPDALTAIDCTFTPSTREDDLARITGIQPPGGGGLDVVDQILAGCKFVAVSADDDNAEFEFGAAIPDVGGVAGAADIAGAAAGALASELGDALGDEPVEPPSNPNMVPSDDSENAQASEIATTNPDAPLKKPTTGPFTQEDLESGDDPLQELDESSSDDPLFGIDPVTDADRAAGI